MKKITTILIDDEPASCDVLKKLITQYCRDVEIKGIAYTADEGINMIREHKPDLLFLDVELPGDDAFCLLKSVHDIPLKTVFVTAYTEYAIKAIKYSALDYILKPIGIEQLMDAIEKFKTQNSQWQQVQKKETNFSKIAIATQYGFDFIDTNKIVWLQASNTYTIFHLVDKTTIISSIHLKHYEELLGDDAPFMRIHHSHIVNLNHMHSLKKTKSSSVLMSDGRELEVSVRKKDALLEMIQKRH